MSKYVTCSKCNGEGKLYTNYLSFPHVKYKKICRHCLGHGRVDWIQNIIKAEYKLKKPETFIKIFNNEIRELELGDIEIFINKCSISILNFEESCNILESKSAKILVDQNIIELEETTGINNYNIFDFTYNEKLDRWESIS